VEVKMNVQACSVAPSTAVLEGQERNRSGALETSAMSIAKVVQGHVAPSVLDAAADGVRTALIPRFMAHPGARHASWMARRTDGRVLILMVWSDQAAVRASRAADGEERARMAERIGLRIDTVLTMELVAATEVDASEHPTRRWARATWVEGAEPDLDLAMLHRETVSDQSRSSGFAGSYWLADREAGNGLALSFWERPSDLHDGERASRRRRRKLERTLGCHIARVTEYEALGAATAEPLLDLRVPVPHIPRSTQPVGAP
jgi:heme-degrading monooxygenase HmoA